MIDRIRHITEREDLLDRHGSDFSRWPDGDAARRVREAVLADPAARRDFDAAKRLDAMMEARASEYERDFDLAERTVAAVSPALAPRDTETRRWMIRLAASFLIAAVLGSAFDVAMWQEPPDELEVAMLESFVFGPDEVEIR